MNLLTPDIGTIFWTSIIFLILLFLLRKFAWKPVLNAIKTRENSITSALAAADRAKKEMSKLQAENEKIMEDARRERDLIMKEARDIKDKIIEEAKLKAEDESKRLIENARTLINNEKSTAITEIKKQIAVFSVDIAEKILRKKLEEGEVERDFIERLIDDVKLN